MNVYFFIMLIYIYLDIFLINSLNIILINSSVIIIIMFSHAHIPALYISYHYSIISYSHIFIIYSLIILSPSIYIFIIIIFYILLSILISTSYLIYIFIHFAIILFFHYLSYYILIILVLTSTPSHHSLSLNISNLFSIFYISTYSHPLIYLMTHHPSILYTYSL
jgi:hypothetical protein